jgi:chromosome segregation ATPase
MNDARYDPDAPEAWCDAVAELGATMPRDLRTADQRAQDELAALALRCDSLQEQLAVAARQIGALEERERAHAAAIERLADMVQALAARAGEGE